MVKNLLSKIYRKYLSFVFRHRLGKRAWSARLLFKVMDFLARFEVYSNSGKVENFDHYVPQFFLRRFQISDTGQNRGRIFQYDFLTQTIKDCPIKEVAGEIGFDAFKDKTGNMSDYISKQLFAETLELRSSYIIKKLNTETEEPSLTYLEESTLVAFIASQLTRVPAFYEAVEWFILYLYGNNHLKIPDLGSLESMEKMIVENKLQITLEQLLNYKSNTSLYGIRNHLGLLTRLISTNIAKKIYKGNLHIVDIPNGSNESFVISDNPVVLLDFERHEISRYPAWWEINKERLWIFMPISPYRCLLYCKSKKKDGRVENNNLDLVRLINFGQYLNATQWVFSNNKNLIKRHLRIYQNELIKLKIKR